MNKKLKNVIITGVAVITLSGTYVLGTKAETTSWKDRVVAKASSDIGASGYNKKTELITNIDTAIDTKITSESDAKIQQRQALVEQQLQDYFDGKITALVNTPEFQMLDSEFDALVQNILTRYKTEIDTAFASRQ